MQPPQLSATNKRPPLRLKLTNQERGYYSNMLSMANPSDPNKLAGPEAVAFFTKSGLPIDVLKQVWLIAAKTSNSYLTKEEFYIALRLIACAQNGKAVDENSIIFDVQVDLPRFDNDQISLAGSQKPPPVQAPAPALNDLPNLDDLDFSSPQTQEHLSRSSFQEPRPQPGQQPPPMQPAPGQPPQLGSGAP